MLRLRDDLEPAFAPLLSGQYVDWFEPEDGELIGATTSVLSYRRSDDLAGRIAAPLVEMVKERAEGQGLRTDGPWRLRYAGLPGDLVLELAATRAAEV